MLAITQMARLGALGLRGAQVLERRQQQLVVVVRVAVGAGRGRPVAREQRRLLLVGVEGRRRCECELAGVRRDERLAQGHEAEADAATQVVRGRGPQLAGRLALHEAVAPRLRLTQGHAMGALTRRRRTRDRVRGRRFEARLLRARRARPEVDGQRPVGDQLVQPLECWVRGQLAARARCCVRVFGAEHQLLAVRHIHDGEES